MLINNTPAPAAEVTTPFVGVVKHHAKYATRLPGGRMRRIDARLVHHNIPTPEEISRFTPSDLTTDALISLVKGIVHAQPALLTARNELLLAALIDQLRQGMPNNGLELAELLSIPRALTAISIVKNGDGDIENDHNRAWWEWRTGVKDITTDEQRKAANAKFARTNYLAAAGAAIAQADRANAIRSAHKLKKAPPLIVVKAGSRNAITIDDLRKAVGE